MNELCQYIGCHKLQRAIGYCDVHYRQLRESGELNRKHAFKARKKRTDKVEYDRKRKDVLDNLQIPQKEYMGLIIKAIPTSMDLARFTTVILKNGKMGLRYMFSSAIQHTDAEQAISEGVAMVDNFYKVAKNGKISQGVEK